MGWVKIGDIQKGKIFTIYGGESFDLKWYSENVEWHSPVVIGTVATIFLDRLFTVGMMARIDYNGGTSYRGVLLSNGVADTQGALANAGGWITNVVHQNGDGGAYGGRVLYPNQTTSWGHIGGCRGFGFSTYIRPNDFQTNWYQNQLAGNFVVTVGGTEIIRTDVRLGNGNINSYTWTPYLEGEVVFHYQVSSSPASGRMHLLASPFYASWEEKAGTITVYANDSQGYGY